VTLASGLTRESLNFSLFEIAWKRSGGFCPVGAAFEAEALDSLSRARTVYLRAIGSGSRPPAPTKTYRQIIVEQTKNEKGSALGGWKGDRKTAVAFPVASTRVEQVV
jgi:hypothetical protein